MNTAAILKRFGFICYASAALIILYLRMFKGVHQTEAELVIYNPGWWVLVLVLLIIGFGATNWEDSDKQSIK